MGPTTTTAGSPRSEANLPVPGGRWLRRLTGPVAAGVTLVLLWIVMLASLRNKSLTYDELGNVTSGYTYWRFNDYRLDPENGNLP
jgi:hypothetical protein